VKRQLQFKRNHKPTAVVYPLGPGSTWDNNELRYSLRSLVANFPNLGPVFVVGHRPDWLSDEAIHIPMVDLHSRNKDANLINKILLAIHHDAMTEHFLRLSDDQMILQPTPFEKMRPRYLHDLADRTQRWWKHNRWKKRLRRTYGLLLKEQRPTYHYDSHIPMPIEAERFAGTMARVDYDVGIGYTINTLYYNLIGMKRRHKLGKIKCTFEKPVMGEDGEPLTGQAALDAIREKLEGKTFLGYNDNGLTPELKQVIMDLYPKPSRFER